jgi:hypothetical protein
MKCNYYFLNKKCCKKNCKKSKFREYLMQQFILWNTTTLGDVIPNCNYDPMINNILKKFNELVSE